MIDCSVVKQFSNNTAEPPISHKDVLNMIKCALFAENVLDHVDAVFGATLRCTYVGDKNQGVSMNTSGKPRNIVKFYLFQSTRISVLTYELFQKRNLDQLDQFI